MNRKIVTILTSILIIFVGLSGCINEEGSSENNPKNINLGDSINYGNIKITFLSATWEKASSWSDTYNYVLKVKGENIGLEEDSVFVKITKYEMENGYSYSDDYIWGSFILNPGRNSTSSIHSNSGSDWNLIDRDYLPVVKIYVTLDENANPMVQEQNPIYIILNV